MPLMSERSNPHKRPGEGSFREYLKFKPVDVKCAVRSLTQLGWGSIDVKENRLVAVGENNFIFCNPAVGGAGNKKDVCGKKIAGYFHIIGNRLILVPLVARNQIFVIEADFHYEFCDGVDGVILLCVLRRMKTFR